ncbi:MAG: hypothetical protein J0I65_27060 [Variovorax sp.]|nr:hypothetical protein [Variovorax sp.]|tara:strand:+ start:567 stop:800 length:234 start_codon:yes stop_codon:yes gene_type:complete
MASKFPPDWALAVALNEHGYHVGTLSYRGKTLCHISFGRPFVSLAEAELALGDTAADWIAEYLQRSHSGETQFGDIE